MVRDDCFRCKIDLKWRQLLVKCFYAKWLNLLAHSHVFREPGLDSDRGSEIKSFKLGGTLHTSNVFQSRPMFISPNFLPWAKAMTQGSYRSRRTVILCFFFCHSVSPHLGDCHWSQNFLGRYIHNSKPMQRVSKAWPTLCLSQSTLQKAISRNLGNVAPFSNAVTHSLGVADEFE